MYPPGLPMMLKIFLPALLVSSATANSNRLQLVRKGYSSHFTDKKLRTKETVKEDILAKQDFEEESLKSLISSLMGLSNFPPPPHRMCAASLHINIVDQPKLQGKAPLQRGQAQTLE